MCVSRARTSHHIDLHFMRSRVIPESSSLVYTCIRRIPPPSSSLRTGHRLSAPPPALSPVPPARSPAPPLPVGHKYRVLAPGGYSIQDKTTAREMRGGAHLRVPACPQTLIFGRPLDHTPHAPRCQHLQTPPASKPPTPKPSSTPPARACYGSRMESCKVCVF